MPTERADAPPAGNPSDAVETLLARPREQREREYKYRFSQSVVFGLPVVALRLWGPALGPRDSDRWVGLLQSLLAGWVVYVNMGMMFEGIILLSRRRVTMDLVITLAAFAAYVASALSVLHLLFGLGGLWFRPLLFSAVVVLLALWTGLRWMISRRAAAPR